MVKNENTMRFKTHLHNDDHDHYKLLLVYLLHILIFQIISKMPKMVSQHNQLNSQQNHDLTSCLFDKFLVNLYML